MKTIKEIQDIVKNTYEGIRYIEGYLTKAPEKPKKPILDSKHTSVDIVKYALDYQNYEVLLESYNILKDLHSKQTFKVYDLLVEYIRDEANLESVPEKYRSKVDSKAWEDGHSEGYYSYYQHLCSLVDIFNESSL